MARMEQQIILGPKDINALTIKCQHCNSRFVLDIDNSASRLSGPCPSCHTPWFPEEGQQNLINRLVECFRELRKIDEREIAFLLKTTPWPAAEATKGQ